MKSFLSENTRNLLIKLREKYQNKIGIFLVFVGISTALWFLNALSSEYDATIKYPVRFTNFPSNEVLLNKLPKNIRIKTHAHGFKLFQYKISTSLVPFLIDIKSLYLRNKENSKYEKYIITDLLMEEMQKQISSEIQIVDILDDTIHFEFAPVVHKKVPLIPRVKLNLEKQYMVIGNYQLEPDSIDISGASIYIDTISAVYTELFETEKINKTIVEKLKIDRQKEVIYKNKNAVLRIVIDKFTESIIEVPVTFYNLPDSLSIISFPANVKIKYLVSLSDYEMINSMSFVVSADAQKIISEKPANIEYEIISQPDFVRSVSSYPRSLEYIIDKKK